jgi:muramoyltetrapeptide carboxypeptidase LdcA involved in peptidoglycan recycling
MDANYPPKPRPGDRVAVVSPSAGLPGLFPHVYELGLRRLREEFGLEPVEYPDHTGDGRRPA